MKIFCSALALLAVVALFWPSRIQASDVYLPDPGGSDPPGLNAATSDDPTLPEKRYYNWRVKMLYNQPLVHDIPTETLSVPVGGVQATLSIAKSRVQPGEKIVIKLALKNVSNSVVWLPRKRRFDDECGLTTLVDGPNGDRVPYRWLSNLAEGHCQITTLVPDWQEGSAFVSGANHRTVIRSGPGVRHR